MVDLAQEKGAVSVSMSTLQALLDLAPEIAWLSDGAGRTVACNDAFARRLTPNAPADSWTEQLEPEARATFIEALDRAVRQQEGFELTLRVRGAPDGPSWIEVHGRPLMTGEG
ncbi:MAG: hypothetical protein HC923_12565, partial [Myxococcales bacterium]|nr:hypothetical protein [Myxococcales bacterium]